MRLAKPRSRRDSADIFEGQRHSSSFEAVFYMKTPTRTLTIEDFNPNGRFAKASYASLLRMKGIWFKDAGFHVGDKVEAKCISPGVLELRVCSPVQIDTSYFSAIKQLNAVLNEDPKPPGTPGPL